jgi:hypothetical protein
MLDKTLVCTLFVATAGCGEVMAPTTGMPDAASQSPDATLGIDGAVALGPFSTPQPLAELAGFTDPGDPAMTADRLELFFSTPQIGGAGGRDIWSSRRATSTDAWGTPLPIAEICTASGDIHPEISVDGLRMWFASRRPGVGGLDIYATARATRAGLWGPPVLITELASIADDSRVSVTADGLDLLLASNRAVGTGTDLYRSHRSDVAATWGPPQLIAEVSTAMDDANASLSADGLTVWFGRGGDIYTATRPSRDGAFGSPVLVTELESTSGDYDIWVSADQRIALFTSERNGGPAIYVATR